MDEVLGFKHMVVWDKGPIGMGFHYRRSYEVVLVSQPIGGGKCNWYDTTKAVENIIRPNTGAKKIIPSKGQHPTEKPWGLAGKFISYHTQAGDTVLDPFVGGGSTGVAAIREDRHFIGSDIDQACLDRTAVRLNDEVAESGGEPRSETDGQ